MLKNTIEDIKNLITMLKIKPREIIIKIAESDRFKTYNSLEKDAQSNRNINELKKKYAKYEYLSKLLKNPKRLPDKQLDADIEFEVFKITKEYIERTFSTHTSIERSKDPKAIPGKPGIEILS